MDVTKPDAQANSAKFIADLGAKAAQAQHVSIALGGVGDAGLPSSIPALWDPKNAALISVHGEAEKYRLAPKRRIGTAKALTLGSFIDLVNRHKTGHSVVFADTNWTAPGFTAVIDYHDVNAGKRADFGRHRIAYGFPLSEEWKAWVAMNGQPMSQIDFATFLEDRIAELATPTEAEKVSLERDFATIVATPADVVQLSRGLQVNVESKVKAAHTLQTGAGQIQWEESHIGADGKPLSVPGIFLLNIAPFFMGEKARIPVRLRYRASGGKVIWHYAIYRPDVHVTERVRTDLASVSSDTGLPTYEGAPEMAGA